MYTEIHVDNSYFNQDTKQRNATCQNAENHIIFSQFLALLSDKRKVQYVELIYHPVLTLPLQNTLTALKHFRLFSLGHHARTCVMRGDVNSMQTNTMLIEQ